MHLFQQKVIWSKYFAQVITWPRIVALLPHALLRSKHRATQSSILLSRLHTSRGRSSPIRRVTLVTDWHANHIDGTSAASQGAARLYPQPGSPAEPNTFNPLLSGSGVHLSVRLLGKIASITRLNGAHICSTPIHHQ